MVQEKLQAKHREILGKKVKKMRREGNLPGIVYGSKFSSLPIQFSIYEFEAVYKKVGVTQIVELEVEGKGTYPVLVKQVQFHPLSDLPTHVDFYKVDMTQKVTAKVPVSFVGESPAVKNNEGVLLELLDIVEVEALPADIPVAFEVNVSSLEKINAGITVSELNVPKGVEIKISGDELVCKIGEPMKEEVEEAPVTVADVEVEHEKKEESVEGEDSKKEEKK